MSTTTTENALYIRLARAEDDVKRIQLVQMRWIATGLLLLVTVVYVVSIFFRSESVVWPYT